MSRNGLDLSLGTLGATSHWPPSAGSEPHCVRAAIELRHLRYFLSATEAGSFRKAAAALHVHESAISRRIRDLEDELGVSLFQRHSGGVTPTLAGRRFLKHVRDAFDEIEQGTVDASAIGRSDVGRIRIGIFSSLASGFLSDLLKSYHKKHFDVFIEIVDGDSADHISKIRKFRLDVAFVAGNSNWLDCETEQLWTERVFVVLPVDHPLCQKADLDWPDLATERFIVSEKAAGPEIYDYLTRRLGDLGWHPDICKQLVGRDNLLSLVAIGRGLTLTSEATTSAQFPGITYRPMIGEELPFSAVWSPKNDNPACRRLLSLARTFAKNINAGATRSASSELRY